MVASILSAAPGVKKIIKRLYVTMNAVIYNKGVDHQVFDERIADIKIPSKEKETFGGYYDRPNINHDRVIMHRSTSDTSRKPSPESSIQLLIKDLKTGKETIIGETRCYNWQQGCRPQWLTDDLIIYNTFTEGEYRACVFSLSEEDTVKTFSYPVQDAFGTEFFLSIDYSSLQRLNPDYCYRNTLPKVKGMEDNGIWKTDFETRKTVLLHSLASLTDCGHQDIFDHCQHTANHVMISPDGKSFIFIHRYFQGKRRFDRLMLSDFQQLKVLVNEGMVSHCHWIDNERIIGFFRYQGIDGFYICNISDGSIIPCQEMNSVAFGDGHPACHGDWIVFDTYPDKSRMQHLFLFNLSTRQIIPLLEVYQGLKYMGESRCDLHPRFSDDGSHISFDSVFQGKRTQCIINISNIVL